MRVHALLLVLLSSTFVATACDDKKGDAKSDKKADDKPSLMLSNDTEACRAALACCEAMVNGEKDGKATPEDINLSCSGVGMADTDDKCGQFKQGYAAAIESKGGELPAECK